MQEIIFCSLKFFKVIYFYVSWCFAYMYVCVDVGNPGMSPRQLEAGYGCWELNLGPLRDQPVLLTSEPCLQLS